MSILLRLLTALISVVIGVCGFFAILASSQVVELLALERKETIESAIVSSMDENRFTFYSASKTGIDEWMKTISSPNLIEYAALKNESGEIVNRTADINSPFKSMNHSIVMESVTSGEHFRLDIPVRFSDGSTVPGYADLELLIKSSREAVYKRVLSSIGTVILFAAIVMVPIILFLTKWVRAPISQIVTDLAEIRPETMGRAPIATSTKTPAELQPVVKTINELLSDIWQHTHNLDNMVASRTSLLNNALISLQSNERQKQTLISNLSHDLKTPLSSIKGYLELVQEQFEDGETENVESNIVKALANSDQILEEINTILNISTAELDGEHHINRVSISALVAESIEKHELLAKKSRNTVTFDQKGNDTIEVNDSTLKHVLDNLLSNANKYTTNGQIAIQAKVNRMITIIVEDEGEPLPDEIISNLFEPKRVEGSARFSLSGMGLFLCRIRVEHAGGIISAERNTRMGLRISFTLPNLAANQRPVI